jgi:hypothetical protein
VRIAYVTTDEVNQDLALRLADDFGAELCPLSPKDPPPNGEFDAMVYDLDYLPPEGRRAILAGLLAGPRSCAVAVHSHNLREDQADALRAGGIAVSSRLEPEMFRLLRPRGRTSAK